MVTKAIERAQNTVEARNAEIRKDVLKYDEVMNEQRKVIYARRLQIIDGEDLREHTEDLLDRHDRRAGRPSTARPSSTRTGTSTASSPSCTQYYPTQFTVEDLARRPPTEQLVESIVGEALELLREAREASARAARRRMRQIEREVMLQIIDQRWREHLSEMDYLREGINLRAMGQTRPARRLAARGLRDVRPADGRHRRRLPPLRHARPGRRRCRAGAEPDLDRASYAAAEDPRGRDRRHWPRRCWPSRGRGARRRRPVLARGPAGGGRRARRRRRGRQRRQASGPDRGRTADGRWRRSSRLGAREGRPQRALLVRERQEVQVLPRRG